MKNKPTWRDFLNSDEKKLIASYDKELSIIGKALDKKAEIMGRLAVIRNRAMQRQYRNKANA